MIYLHQDSTSAVQIAYIQEAPYLSSQLPQLNSKKRSPDLDIESTRKSGRSLSVLRSSELPGLR